MHKQFTVIRHPDAQHFTNTAHPGQGLVRLLRGAAVRLGDITEGEGHVLKGKVAVKQRERRGRGGRGKKR